MNTINIDFAQFVQIQHAQPVTTSEFVAKAFGKSHKNILAKIDEIITQVPDFFEKLNFKPLEKTVKSNLGSGSYTTRAYELTKDGFMLLVMGFTGKEAMAIKIAYIEAFNQMADKLKQIEGNNKVQIGYTLNEWEQEQIKAAVKNRSIRTGETTQAIYVKLHSFMRVARYEQITQAEFQTALNYLASMEYATVVKQPTDLKSLPSLLQYSMYMSQFILRYYPALHMLNKELASGLYSNAEHAYIAVLDIADKVNVKIPSNKYWEYYPFDGEYEQKQRYKALNIA